MARMYRIKETNMITEINLVGESAPNDILQQASLECGRDVPGRIFEAYDDFIGGAGGIWNTRVSGTGSSATVAQNDPSHDGILTLATGTTTTGYAAVGAPVNGTILPGMFLARGLVVFDVMLNVVTVSDDTDTFYVHSGFSRQMPIAGPANETVEFRYTHNVNGGRFEAVNRASAVETAVDTGITVVAGNWYRLRIECAADGSVNNYYIGNAGAAPALVAAISTNLPLTAIGPSTIILKSAGTTSRTIGVDYKYVRKEFTVSR